MDKITKRLHISGLTPSITKEDLQRRLSSFGTVKALDGFGLLDAVGRPRKFGYITIETTAPQLAKCLNLLSGSTWKGTKLRLGDAKPDFRERLARERDAEEPPRKRRRRGRAEHAEDMSLVTSENVGEKRGWKVMPSGRMVHPLRMKPSKPLAPRPTLVGPQGSKRESQKKVKSRVKPPPTRARRRLIDPTAWGSTHLKGDLLDVIGNGQRISEAVVENVELDDHSDPDESDEESYQHAR
ncbi:hypothetical protein ONZ45_g18437 [Pleurotus djamor]|nr:hypothetical protein ONZ45_g18437 [Pleurotus djamor]